LQKPIAIRVATAAAVFFGATCVNTTAWMAPAVSLDALAAAGTGQSFVPLSASNSLLRLRFGPERAGAGRGTVLRAVFRVVTSVDLLNPAADVAGALGARGAALLKRAETLFLATTAVVAAGAAPDPRDPAATPLLARVVQVHHSTATTAGA